MPQKFKLTKSSLLKLNPGLKTQVYWDTHLPSFGIRLQPTGRIAYFIQTRFNGKNVKATIGRFPQMSPEAARKEALSQLNSLQKGQHESQQPSMPSTTFGTVLEGYVAILEREGKSDINNVRNTINKHVRDAFPKLWITPATTITHDDCVRIIRSLIVQEKLRTADRLRAYIHAAYERLTKPDPNTPSGIPILKIANPAKMVPVKGANKARDRFLSEAELRHFWHLAQQLPSPDRELISLQILLGGQRQAQITRCQLENLSQVPIQGMTSDLTILEIRDRKGRSAPSGGRLHLIPVLPEAVDLMSALTPSGGYIFSADGGVTPIHNDKLNRICRRLRAHMAETGLLEGGDFTAGDLRRTIETLLAKSGVSREDRGHLQSHGISGVQARHYDRYDYLEPKLRALQTLRSLLESNQ